MNTLEAQALAVLRQNDALKGGELRIGLGNSMPGMALIAAFHRLYSNIHALNGSSFRILNDPFERGVCGQSACDEKHDPNEANSN